MLLFAVLAAALIVAVLTGGDVRRLSAIRVKHPEFLIGAFAARAVVAVLGTLHSSAAVNAAKPLNVLVGLLLVIFVWLNRHLPGALLFGVGQCLNLIALISFGGRMPVILPASANPRSPRLALLISNLDPLHVLLQHPQGLWFFGDILTIPILGRSSVLSVGDVLMAAAVGWLVIRYSHSGPAPEVAYRSSPAG